MDTMNLKHAYDDYVHCDMSFPRFQEICKQCWSAGKHGFLTINREKEKNKGKYCSAIDVNINIDA